MAKNTFFFHIDAVFPSLVPEEKSPLKGPKRDQIFGKKGTKKGPKGIKKGTSRGIYVRYFQNLIRQNHNSKTAHYGKRMYNEYTFSRSFKDKRVFSGFPDKLMHLQ